MVIWTAEECFQNLPGLISMFLKNKFWVDRIILWAADLFFMLDLSIKMPNFMKMFLKNELRIDRIILWAADVFLYVAFVYNDA